MVFDVNREHFSVSTGLLDAPTLSCGQGYDRKETFISLHRQFLNVLTPANGVDTQEERNVKIGTIDEEPRKTVCMAARNDYRSDGVLDHDYREIMDEVSVDYDRMDEIAEEEGISWARPAEVHDWFRDEQNRLRAKERMLVDHLMDGGHWGPFEHVYRTIAIEGVTRVSMAQLTRHRQFTFDVMSLRYVKVDTGDVVEDVPLDEQPALEHLFEYPDEFTDDQVVDRHGVENVELSVETRLRTVNDAYKTVADAYDKLTDAGVPQEEARKLLPMGTKVNMVVSGNARAWMHLLTVRSKANVQGEARQIVERCFDELREWMPYVFGQFDERLPMQLTP